MIRSEAEARGRGAAMTVDQALSLARCPSEGRCFPRCPHCLASPEQIEAARAWLEEHPHEEDAWAAERLGGIVNVIRHWRAAPATAAPAPHWQVCDGATAIVGGLTVEQAEAIVQQHNQQVTSALGILDWYLGT